MMRATVAQSERDFMTLVARMKGAGVDLTTMAATIPGPARPSGARAGHEHSPNADGFASAVMSLPTDLQQAVELAFGVVAKGEAQSATPAGIEAVAAFSQPESPAAMGPSMEAIVARDNLRKALA